MIGPVAQPWDWPIGSSQGLGWTRSPTPGRPSLWGWMSRRLRVSHGVGHGKDVFDVCACPVDRSRDEFDDAGVVQRG